MRILIADGDEAVFSLRSPEVDVVNCPNSADKSVKIGIDLKNQPHKFT